METGKRKRSADRVPRRRLAPPEDETDDKLVTDNEVEEFFILLKRVRETRCLIAAARPRAAVTAGEGGEARWNPSFSREDFSAAPDAIGRGTMEKKRSPSSPPPPSPPSTGAKGLIDLNAEPETEHWSAGSPRGEGSARCAQALA